MRRAATISGAVAVLMVALAGCWHRPPDDAGFGEVRDLNDLEGVYRNVPEEAPGGANPAYPHRLSRILWPSDKGLDHLAIETVDVRKADARTLRVRALTPEGAVVKEGTYVEGRDFALRKGRLVLVDRPGIAGFKAGEPIIGVYVEGAQIGLDERGQGKYRTGFAVAGLVFSFFPMVYSDTEDMRFIKVAP